jgi:uncharacterized repeat protein (TIGR01451 family)
VETWGGGGGGGGVGNVYYADAGGGAGGSYVRASQSVTAGTTYYITVGTGGSGGAGGTNTSGTGGTGNPSYFGTSSSYLSSAALVLAVGGPGGQPVTSTGTSTTYNTSLGGTATNSGNVLGTTVTYNYAGTSGTNSANKASGAGGNGAGSTGSAGGGAGGAGLTSKANGNPGTAPGGSGSGGQQGSSVASNNGIGGAGGAGQITLSWVAATPGISSTGTPTAMVTNHGTASVPTSFSASGTNLTANITVTAPTGFEVSTTSGSGYAGSLTLTQSSGTVSSTTIYVRLTAADAAGTYSGNVSLASTGATTVNVAVPSSTVAAPFTAGNLVVQQADNGAVKNTSFTMVEVNPAGTGTTVQSIPLTPTPITVNSTPGLYMRMNGSGGTTGYVANSNDGTLLTFASQLTTSTTTSDDDATVLLRGVGTMGSSAAFSVPTTYTGISSNQCRGATTVDNSTWIIADKGGIYTNSGTSPTGSTINILATKSYGGTVYSFSAAAPGVDSVVASGTTPPIGTLSALTGLSIASYTDFCLISSGVNGATYDICYVALGTNSTTGSIKKFSLVGGTWQDNSAIPFATGVGGRSILAAGNGSGATIYITSADGATAANNVYKLTDTAGYNQTINIATVTSSNIIYTAPSGAIAKGVALAPTSSALPDLTIAASAPASAGASFNYTLTVANSGAASASGITAQFTLPVGLTFVSASDTGSAGFVAPTTAPSGVVTFTGGALSANSSETLIVSVTAALGTYTAAAGAAIVDPSNTITESNENNNTSNIAAITDVVSAAISVSGSLVALSATYGTASMATSFSVSGYGLSGNLTVTPPAGFEVSSTSATGGFGSTATLIPDGNGNVAATTIYVRLTASAAVSGSPYSGNVSVSGGGAGAQIVAIPSSTVSPLALTLSGAAVTTKPWDGTTAATITGTLVTIIPGDTVTLVGTGTFAQASDGTGIAVTAACTLSGANAGNYTLTQPTGLTGSISASANLGGLASSAGGFTAAFGAGTTSYTQYVGSSVTSVTLTPTADTGATVTVNGASAGTPVSLNAGVNTITVTVTNGSLTQTYTLNVTVAGAFTQGDLVVTMYGNLGVAPVHSDGQTTVISLAEFSPTIAANSSPLMVFPLPSAASGNNVGITGEYATSSESRIQLTGDGQYLTIGGYSAAQAFIYAPNSVPNGALAQSPCATVPRVMALISASGNVDTSSVFNDIYNTNNPRCVYSPDDTHLYLSGQGSGSGDEGGIYYTQVGTNTTSGGAAPTGIFNGVSTRQVQIYQGNLYYTCDQNSSSKGTQTGIFEFTGTPTTASSPLTNTGTRLTPANNGSGVNYSPDGIFFANATTMYVADTGVPKIGTGSGAGGIQKWVYNGSAWVLQYNMTNSNFVSPSLAPTATHGETGFEAIAGKVVGGVAYLYAVSYTAGDGDPDGLYAITDTVSATSYSGQTFTEIAAAPGIQASGTNPDFIFKGVSFAPVALVPDLTVNATHTGTFTQGDAADTCTVTVNNSGTATATGTVTVVDTFPAGLTPAASMNGTIINGWNIAINSLTPQTVTATRNDGLAASGTFPALTLTFAVTGDAASSLVNSVTVSGGGEVNTSNDSATDTFSIAPGQANIWRQTNFGFGATDSGSTADNASYSGDGISNLIKYALGLNPLVTASQSALPADLNGTTNPTFSDRLSIGFTLPYPTPGDIVYNVEATSDLINWTTVATKTGTGAWTWIAEGAAHLVTNDGTSTSSVQVGDNVTTAGNPHRMMRLQIVRP